MSLSGAWAVFRFECRRTATLPRIAWWFVLALFPALVCGLMLSGGAQPHPQVWLLVLLGLNTGVVCLLGLLLWATPILSSELEGRTWIYLAVRPGGKLSMLLGKYAIAVVWTATAGWLATALSVAVVRPPEALRMAVSLIVLVFMSSVAYAALFVFLGVLLYKRAMVLAVAYALVFEVLVGLIPAMINQFTVQYRLRSLLMKWMDYPGADREIRLLVGTAPTVQHVLILSIFTALLLLATATLLQRRQFAISDE